MSGMQSTGESPLPQPGRHLTSLWRSGLWTWTSWVRIQVLCGLSDAICKMELLAPCLWANPPGFHPEGSFRERWVSGVFLDL
jgi:hypothetical protein